MFTFILWAVIIGIIILIFRRVARGAVVTLVLVGSIFLAVFLIDSGTTFPLRSLISLDWYDKTVEDPQGTVEGVSDKVAEGGNKAIDGVNKVGEDLDKKYELESKRKESSKEDTTEGNENKTKENKEESTKGDKSFVNKELLEGKIYINYKDIDKYLRNELKELSDKDKEIIKSMTSIYKTSFEGDDIKVSNDNDKGDKGIYVEIK